jgi:hypothetical protein
MSKCEWGYSDCRYEGIKCNNCYTPDSCYSPKKQEVPVKRDKLGKRMGAKFELQNHKSNQAILNTGFSMMTPNSGATNLYKGDEQIKGLVRVMEELKTGIIKQAPGKETFTIKKQWLRKLKLEATAENQELYYLKFRFNEEDEITYCIIDAEQIMSCVYTLKKDRETAKNADLKIQIAEKQRDVLAAENLLLKEKIKLLELEKEQLERS